MTDAQLVQMFKALAHPNRFRLFQEIRSGSSGALPSPHSCFLTDIMDRLNVGAPTVSHHLKELVRADLVRTDKEGKFVTCRVNQSAVDALRGFLDQG